jgi:GT2 family glycosyltransferase/glycosyltransferase involved in cell wall biosynthesis
MSVEDIGPEARLALPRGTVAVAVPVFGAYDMFVQCIKSVLDHTPEDVPILIADDASPDPKLRELVGDLERSGKLRHRVIYMRQPENVGFVSNMNAVFRVTDEADVVSVNSDCVVPAGWLRSLRDAAYSDSLVATASTLTNHGTIVSVPFRNRPQPILPQEWSFDMAASAIASMSRKLYPHIPTGIGHCLYIRRSALDVVGYFDESFSPGYGEEVDFCQRCVLTGLSHVVADNVLVFHHGRGSFSVDRERSSLQQKHDELISSRYGYYDDWIKEVAEDDTSQLAQSLSVAARALRGLTVTIDGRILTRFMTGTQLQTLELIAALADRTGIQLRVVIPPDLGDYARRVLDARPHIGLLALEDVGEHTERSHIAHRPYQVSSSEDLTLLNKLGERAVITHLDLISYFNPGYHSTYDEWREYRHLTRVALGMAERVVFISAHAARSAVEEGLVDSARAAVVYLGTDHRISEAVLEARMPEGLDGLAECPFLLCLGTDFRHKNRRFALRLLEALQERHGWKGGLVLAGPHVVAGSSAGEEAEYAALHPELAAEIVEIGAVDDAEKAWLYRNAAAVVYPTLHEGFGLLPYEAAEAGVPCLFAPQSSLAELLPSRLALLERWDPEASADRAMEVLSENGRRLEHVRSLRAAAAGLSWDRTAIELKKLYEDVVGEPMREAKRLTMELTERDALIQFRYADIASFDRIDRLLVGPGGALPAELRRAVLGIANRRFLRAIVFGPLILAYRLVYFLRHRRLPAAQIRQEA